MRIPTTENLLSILRVMGITNGDIVIVASDQIYMRYDSWVDGDVDRLVSDLMMYSLSNDIVNVELDGLTTVYIHLRETKSTTSNIDADVIEMLYHKLK